MTAAAHVPLILCLSMAWAVGAVTASAQSNSLANNLDRLLAAYPEQLARIDGRDLVWTDGTRMPLDDGRGVKTHAALLATADLKDMFFTSYPRGPLAAPPALNVDPGRPRNIAFFDKMYGDCTTGQVNANLVDVIWLPQKWGKPLKVTRINGVAAKLAAVSHELDALPAAFDGFLVPSSGTYNCRPIAGTTRVSAHGYGIAIDLATAHTDYWLWARDKTNGNIPYRNKIPPEIVAVFEAHGFIWGGKWYHYDTMHFEYRPELLGR